MDVLDLAGAGVAFVVENDVVGAAHFLFGGELVGHAGLKLLGGGVVALDEAAHTLGEVEVDADDFVDHTVECVFVDYGTLKDEVGCVGVLLGKLEEVVPDTGMDKLVEALEGLGVGKDDAGDGGLVGGAVGLDDGGSEEGAYLVEEGGVAVVGTGHLVGYEAGDSQCAELLQDCGFAAADAAGKSHIAGPDCGGGTICF